MPPLGPGGGSGFCPPPAVPGPPPLSLPLLPQLEQKGRLQRLVAKDVSAQRWGCRTVSAGFGRRLGMATAGTSSCRAGYGTKTLLSPGMPAAVAPWRREGAVLGYSHAWGRGRGSPAHIPLSLQVQPPDPASIRVLRGHQLPVTCLVISPDDRFIFSASKDGSLIKCKCSLGATTGCSPSPNPAGTPQQQDRRCPWRCLGPAGDVDVHRFGLCGRLIGAFRSGGRLPGGDSDAVPVGEVESGKRLCVVPGGKKGTEERHMGHASHVLCMAISSDGKYLVWEEGAGAAAWGREVAVGSAFPPGVLGGSVSCPDVPCWVKAAPTPTGA